MKYRSMGSVIVILLVASVVRAQIDGAIVAWGDNTHGQCNIPSNNTGFVAVAAWDHSLCLKSDGSILAMGRNNYGESIVPSPNTDFVSVAAGGYHSLGLKADGSVVAWGLNQSGQCNVPAPNMGFIEIAAGGYHCLGLKSDGSIVAWGAISTVPTPNSEFIAVAAGRDHNMALKANGTIVAWGDNQYGQCNIPSPNSSFIAIARGCYHSLGLKANGTVVAWGSNSRNQCVVPAPNNGFVAISGGTFHSLGLKSDGSLVAWGDNRDGQCSVPLPNTEFVTVAGGDYHSIALKRSAFSARVTDIPQDQGGRLRISWYNHPHDEVGATSPITSYDIQKFNTVWQTLISATAAQLDSYAIDVDTSDILTIGQPAPYSLYRLVANTANPLVAFESQPDSGYSIDNLSPEAPVLDLFDTEISRALSWVASSVPDLTQTCLYRGTEPNFIADDPILCSATQTWYLEDHLARYYYRARSFDIHGNASEWSNEVVGQYPTGVPGAMPTALRLYPNQPNPFNPMTTIKYDVPAEGRTTLRVYDVRGALVRTLIDADLPRGTHQATWDGRDASGRGMASGSYFARLEAGGRVETARMSLVR